MKHLTMTTALERLQPHLERLDDPNLSAILSEIFHLIETIMAENAALHQDRQRLRDEVNRLKGEQSKPDIKPPTQPPPTLSSERERRHAERDEEGDASRVGFRLTAPSVAKLKEHRIPEAVLDQLAGLQGTRYDDEAAFLQDVADAVGPDVARQYGALLVQYARYRKRCRRPKIPEITIDREELCPVDEASLPPDAIRKGYEEKVVQDVRIQTDNVKFYREAYYSPSQKQTYLGKVPRGYDGEFGPHIKTQILSMKYVNGMSIPKIQEFYEALDVQISRTYISDRLTKHLDIFHQEKSAVYQASLEQSRYHHIDDTTSRVNGQNHYTHIVCNPSATLFFTTPRKDRLTILEVLQDGQARRFLFDAEAFRLLDRLKVPKTVIGRLQELAPARHLTEQEMDALLSTLFPDPTSSPRQRARIREAGAIASYHQQLEYPIVDVLVCDDAPQFKLLTEELALGWVHDGRHYKRLQPVVPQHRALLDAFLQQYWEYYRALYLYKQAPSAEEAQRLSTEFDTLFSTTTGYAALDDRIAKSGAKKQELLAVLRHPELPLHNNPAEHGARVQKRRADVSLHTKAKIGTKAQDTMMSIVETCKKLRVNVYQFLYDRINQHFHLPSLADVLRAKTASQPENTRET
jgi:hypothetical protein